MAREIFSYVPVTCKVALLGMFANDPRTSLDVEDRVIRDQAWRLAKQGHRIILTHTARGVFSYVWLVG